MREEDVVDLITGSRQDRILIERDRLELGTQQIQVRCRQCCEKAITISAGSTHWWGPAVKRQATNLLSHALKN